jgi:hypothetical protein
LLRNVFLEYSSNKTYEKYAKKSFPLKPVSQFKANMAWMVLKWTVKLINTTNTTTRVSPSLNSLKTKKATTYYVENPGSGLEQASNVAGGHQIMGIIGSPTSLKQTWHGWSLSGKFSKLCPLTLTSIQNGHLM